MVRTPGRSWSPTPTAGLISVAGSTTTSSNKRRKRSHKTTTDEEEETLGQFAEKQNSGKKQENQCNIPECIRFLKRSHKDRFVAETYQFSQEYSGGRGKNMRTWKPNTDYNVIRWVTLDDGTQVDLCKKPTKLRQIDWRVIALFYSCGNASAYNIVGVRNVFYEKLLQKETVQSGGAIGLRTSEQERLRTNTIIRLCNCLFLNGVQEIFMEMNSNRTRSDMETGAGSSMQRFYNLVLQKMYQNQESLSDLLPEGVEQEPVSQLGESQFTQQNSVNLLLEDTQEPTQQDTQPTQQDSINLLADTPPMHQPTQPTQEPTQPTQVDDDLLDDSEEEKDDMEFDQTYARHRANVDSLRGEQETLKEQQKIDEIAQFDELEKNFNFDQERYYDFIDAYDINPCDYVVWNVAEIKQMVLLLVKARQQLHSFLHGTSGSHTSQPQDFVDRALTVSGTTKKVGPAALVYFYWKTKCVVDYDTKFSPFLHASMKGDSSNVVELLDGDKESPGKYTTKEDVNLDKMTESLSSLNSSASRYHRSQEELTTKMKDLKEEQLKKERMATLEQYERYYERKKAAGAGPAELATYDKMLAKQEVIVFGQVITERLLGTVDSDES